MDITILGIESSCDDTSAAVIRNTTLLSNVIASQAVHVKYGGVIPELASRAHQQNIIPVVDTALKEAGVTADKIDAIAFTRGPGLLGSLLVGTSFAKGLSMSLGKPLVEVNHLQGHILANFIKQYGQENRQPEFPYLCLLVSGGNSQIVKVNSPLEYEILGQTIDDAVGEAFDKCAKMMGLGYPGGPIVDRLAKEGDPLKYKFSKPQIPGFDYSFSGIKTSLLYFVRDQIAVDPDFKDGMIKGVFGQFPDGVVPGMMCFEMGLSSFGDNFAWLKRFLAGTMKTLLAGKVSAEVLAEAEDKILPSLAEAAAKLPFREDAPFASDWFNGRRSPAPNPSLRATVSGLGLATDAAEVYYAIVEATAFGVKAMVDTLVDNGVALESITAIGGIAVKSPFIVQFLADVLGMEIFVPNLTQACGLGAAINASVASGCWPGLLEAQEAMCVTEGVRYTPSSARDFSRRYERYRNM